MTLFHGVISVLRTDITSLNHLSMFSSAFWKSSHSEIQQPTERQADILIMKAARVAATFCELFCRSTNLPKLSLRFCWLYITTYSLGCSKQGTASARTRGAVLKEEWEHHQKFCQFQQHFKLIFKSVFRYSLLLHYKRNENIHNFRVLRRRYFSIYSFRQRAAKLRKLEYK